MRLGWWLALVLSAGTIGFVVGRLIAAGRRPDAAKRPPQSPCREVSGRAEEPPVARRPRPPLAAPRSSVEVASDRSAMVVRGLTAWQRWILEDPDGTGMVASALSAELTSAPRLAALTTCFALASREPSKVRFTASLSSTVDRIDVREWSAGEVTEGPEIADDVRRCVREALPVGAVDPGHEGESLPERADASYDFVLTVQGPAPR